MITARQKILTHLKRNRAVSAREIARALNMSAPNVRHHLRVLVSDGRAEVMSVRWREGKGRPEKVYSLSRAALGDNLAGLANALLAEAGLEVRMEAVGERLASLSNPASLPISKRLAIIVEELNELHYMARWEASAEGPRLILGHCPYAAIIEKQPGLCRMDAAMLSAISAMKAEQKMKLEGIVPMCVFLLRD
ncbi:MAG: helix-turn-helix domain-containing protein [Chloroflexi bacterium]|nr:helix-turn-helix domain-containing protein [Chloroflexota bacterium]